MKQEQINFYKSKIKGVLDILPQLEKEVGTDIISRQISDTAASLSFLYQDLDYTLDNEP